MQKNRSSVFSQSFSSSFQVLHHWTLRLPYPELNNWTSGFFYLNFFSPIRFCKILPPMYFFSRSPLSVLFSVLLLPPCHFDQLSGTTWRMRIPTISARVYFFQRAQLLEVAHTNHNKSCRATNSVQKRLLFRSEGATRL